MGQPGFFDADKRLAALSKKGDPLAAIAALVPWESFRADMKRARSHPDAEKKSCAGRQAVRRDPDVPDADPAVGCTLSRTSRLSTRCDRMSFTRFLGLEFEDDIPDGTTLWLFREKLAQAGLVEALFDLRL